MSTLSPSPKSPRPLKLTSFRVIVVAVVALIFSTSSFIESVKGEEKVVFSKGGGPNNFGLIVNNQTHIIYRSSKLGAKGLRTLKEYLSEKNLPFPKTIIYMNHFGYKRKLISFDLFALQEYEWQEKLGYHFYHSYDPKVRTYLDGHNPYHPTEDIDKKSYLNEKAQKLFGLRTDGQKDGGVEDFIRILELVLDKNNQPVLFHCKGGRHRTGMVALAIRYLQGGNWIHGPKKKIFVFPKFKSLLLNPAQYEYALHNRELFRMENLQFIEKFSQDERFLKLKEKYSKELQLEFEFN